MLRPLLALNLAVACALLNASSAFAQQPANTGAVRPASYQAATECQFQYRPAKPGERYRQQVQYGVNLKTQIRQSGQVVADSHQRIARLQQRRVEVLPKGSDASTVVRVTFDRAQQQIGGPKGPMKEVPQPVQGKTYVVSRHGEAPLSIQNVDGTEVPTEELEILRIAMDAVGRTNPLGQFLNGKSLRVGQQIELPKEVATTMFSSGGKSAPEGIERFVLTLRNIESHEARPQSPIAIFDTTIVMTDKLHADGRVQIAGQMVLDIRSCRALSTNIEGPLHITEHRGPKQAQFIVEGRGQMNLATQTVFETEIR